MKNYYAILGLPETAYSGDPLVMARDIKRAYRQLARRYHPDFHEDKYKDEAEARFRDITEAWEKLGRPASRAKYDKEFSTWISRDTRNSARSVPAWTASTEPFPEPDVLDLTEEAEAIALLTEAINEGKIPGLYVRSGKLVYPDLFRQQAQDQDSLTVRDVDPALLRNLVRKYLNTIALKGQEMRRDLPRPEVCRAILAETHWPDVPPYNGSVSIPVLRRDGTILQDQGYDPGTGLFLHCSVPVARVPADPTPDEVAAARRLLLDVMLPDFAWVEPADRANYLAAAFTPMLRRYGTGLSPLIVITAAERGEGKTLLVHLTRTLYGGAVMKSYTSNNEEMRKSITSSLRDAKEIICFDNVGVEQVVDSYVLARVLTEDVVNDRLLGVSEDISVANDRLWFATGTNVRIGGDMGQRTVLVRLNYGKPDPNLRDPAKFAVWAYQGEQGVPEDQRQLLDMWAEVNRAELLHAMLTLVRAWVTAGAPRNNTHTMRLFTNWAQVIGGLLSFHGISGFLANSIEVHGFDTDREIWTPYLKFWHEHWHEPLTAARLLELGSSSPEFAALEPRSDSGSAYNKQSLGIALKGRAGRYYGDPDEPVKYVIEKNYDTHSKLNKFRVVKYEPEPNGSKVQPAIEPPPAEPEQADPYAGYNTSQLRGLAHKHGVQFERGATRDQLIKALTDAGITP